MVFSSHSSPLSDKPIFKNDIWLGKDVIIWIYWRNLVWPKEFMANNSIALNNISFSNRWPAVGSFTVYTGETVKFEARRTLKSTNWCLNQAVTTNTIQCQCLCVFFGRQSEPQAAARPFYQRVRVSVQCHSVLVRAQPASLDENHCEGSWKRTARSSRERSGKHGWESLNSMGISMEHHRATLYIGTYCNYIVDFPCHVWFPEGIGNVSVKIYKHHLSAVYSHPFVTMKLFV